MLDHLWFQLLLLTSQFAMLRSLELGATAELPSLLLTECCWASPFWFCCCWGSSLELLRRLLTSCWTSLFCSCWGSSSGWIGLSTNMCFRQVVDLRVQMLHVTLLHLQEHVQGVDKLDISGCWRNSLLVTSCLGGCWWNCNPHDSATYPPDVLVCKGE